jgi:hypothetical protein
MLAKNFKHKILKVIFLKKKTHTRGRLSLICSESISFSDPYVTHGLETGGSYFGGSFGCSGGKTTGG